MPKAFTASAALAGLRANRLALLISAIPLVLAYAHYMRGAETDDPSLSLMFAFIVSVLSLITLISSRKQTATLGTIGVIAISAVWLALGLFGNWYRAQSEIFSLFAAGAIFLSGRVAGMRTPTLLFVWRTLIWSLAAYSALALVAHTLNYTGASLTPGAFETSRLHASFVSPNTAATLFAISALIGAGYLLYTVNHVSADVQTRNQLIDFVFRKSAMAIVLFFLAISCLWLTLSRACIATFLVIAVVLFGAEYRAYRKRRHSDGRSRSKSFRALRWSLFALSILFAVIVFNSEMLIGRVSEAATDAQSRLDLFSIYLGAWLTEPWFGHGLGSFNRVNDSLMTLDNVAYVHQMGAAHNVVIQWLIQQGIIGTALMAAIIVSIHIPMIRVLRLSMTRSKTLIRCVMCISGLVFLHGMVDYALEIPSIMWTYAFLLGMAHGRASALLGSNNVSTEDSLARIMKTT